MASLRPNLPDGPSRGAFAFKIAKERSHDTDKKATSQELQEIRK